MDIKILTSTHGFMHDEIPDDFEFLRVTCMTGDEIIEVYREDLVWGDPYLYKTLDPERDNRLKNIFDCTYIVRPDQIEIWNSRQRNYHIWQKNEFKAIFDGYVGTLY